MGMPEKKRPTPLLAETRPERSQGISPKGLSPSSHVPITFWGNG